jgi:hypothetical protein
MRDKNIMISVVMAYYNRRRQLDYTLKTIAASKQCANTEIVIVDDFSSAEHRLDNLCHQWPQLKITVIEMRGLVDKKNYCNPCVPYNVGFRASQGNHIVIQNPECCHVGDILNYVTNNLSDSNYLSFHTYGCTKEDLTDLYAKGSITMFSHSKKARWYNHQTERPSAFHFCNAITRHNLIKLNGFDESYSQGHNYDDAELVARVKALGVSIQFVANPWSIHQYHPKSYGHPDNPAPSVDNRALYQQLLEHPMVTAPNTKIIE